MGTRAPPFAVEICLETCGLLQAFGNTTTARQAVLKHAVATIEFSGTDVEEQLHSEEEAQLWCRVISEAAAQNDRR